MTPLEKWTALEEFAKRFVQAFQPSSMIHLHSFFDAVDWCCIPYFSDFENSFFYPTDHPRHGRRPQIVFDLVSEVGEISFHRGCCTQEENDRLDKLFELEDFDAFYELRSEIIDRYINPILCSVQIAMDLLWSPVPGAVLGVTLAEIEGLYPEGVPEWITRAENWSLPYSEIPKDLPIAL